MTVGRRVVRDEITGEPLAAQPDDAGRVVRVALTYPLVERPEQVTFTPALTSSRSAPSIGFVVYHQGVAVNDFRYLTQPGKLRLGWRDP